MRSAPSNYLLRERNNDSVGGWKQEGNSVGISVSPLQLLVGIFHVIVVYVGGGGGPWIADVGIPQTLQNTLPVHQVLKYAKQSLSFSIIDSTRYSSSVELSSELTAN